MILSELLTTPIADQIDCPVNGLALDSRTVSAGDVFLALGGTQTHGERYIDSALQKGAVAVLKEAPVTRVEILADDKPCISLPNLSEQVGEIAARFYGHPSRQMHVIGVTGTNGKTTVTHAIAQLLSAHTRCGLIGTLGYGIYGQLQPASHTTPNAIRLQALFAQQLGQNVKHLVMEVSSHALAQGRVNGITFETALLTNLSRDHLDYHQTMTAYGDTKRRLFTMPDLKTAVINIDDTFGQSVLADLPTTVAPLTYSLHDKTANVYAEIDAYLTGGLQLQIHTDWGQGVGKLPWYGQFNVSNALATVTVLLNMGFPLPQLLKQLSTLRTIPGRMEQFGQANQPTVIVDYAHTPDALEKVLLELRQHFNAVSGKNTQSVAKLWCVFGCGGDRDSGKRQLMGEVAQRLADNVIITDDNPRHESSQAIINDILPGCPAPTAVISDRQQAIHYALQNAAVGDIVLIAGKGHEEYQQIGDQRLPFSDRNLVSSLLNKDS